MKNVKHIAGVVLTSFALATLSLPAPALAEAREHFEDSDATIELGRDISRTLGTTFHKMRASFAQVGRDAAKYFDSSALGAESADTRNNAWSAENGIYESSALNSVSDTPGIEWSDDGTVCTVTGDVTTDDLSQELWGHSDVQVFQTQSGASITGSGDFLFGVAAEIRSISFNNAQLSLTGTEGMFMACSFLESIVFPETMSLSLQGSANSMFSDLPSLRTVVLSNAFSTSNVESMQQMFANCEKLETLELPESFDISQVKDSGMMDMFSGCIALKALKLPNSFNPSQATSMSGMFKGCKALKELGFPTVFSTSKVQSFGSMFSGCESLKTLDLPNTFDTSSANTMIRMFQDCSSLENLTLPAAFNTSLVDNMERMFSGCSSLQTLELPAQFKTPKVAHMDYMFMDCSKLKTLNLKTFSSEKLDISYGMFANCDRLEELNLGNLTIPQSAGEVLNPESGMFATLGPRDGETSNYPITGSIPNIKKITMSGSCILTPGEGDTTRFATGTFFDYKEPLSWGAYYHGDANNDISNAADDTISDELDTNEATPTAILTGFDEFKAYQENHPGLTTYVFGMSPIPPGPTPDAQDGTASGNGTLAKTGDLFSIASLLTGVTILSGLALLSYARRRS